jgi:hypothetical protein
MDCVAILAQDLLLSSRMRELFTGTLMLLACGAVYIQSDPTIWNSFSLILSRFIR